jgi:hypothetical protein
VVEQPGCIFNPCTFSFLSEIVLPSMTNRLVGTIKLLTVDTISYEHNEN